MNNIVFKSLFKQGIKGDKGANGLSFEVPTGAVMAFDGVTTPEGYEETSAPSDIGSTIVTKNITANGTYRASSDNADGYDPVIVNVAPDSRDFVYNWIWSADQSIVVRQKISDGSFKIWFKNLTIDQIISGQYRVLVPDNLQLFAQRMNGVGATYEGVDTTGGATTPVTGYVRFEMVSSAMYVYCTKLGSNYRLNGYIERALMWSSMTGNGNNVDLETEWSEPTFDPING